jgi:hypothetical protein
LAWIVTTGKRLLTGETFLTENSCGRRVGHRHSS